MPDATTYDKILEAISNGNGFQGYLYSNLAVAGTTPFAAAAGVPCRHWPAYVTLPSLPSGISKYRATLCQAISSGGQASLGVGQVINMGNIDISGASGTFTDGAAYPTRTELGVANNPTYGPLLAVVTSTSLNATPGSLAINYTDQDGNSGSISATALTASATYGQGSFLTLAAGDCGIRDVTGATRSAGTTPTGTITFYGIIPLAIVFAQSSQAFVIPRNLVTDEFVMPPLAAGDKVGFVDWSFTTQAQTDLGTVWFFGEST